MTAAVCLGIIGIIFFGDLYIKNYIERSVGEEDKIPLLGGRLLIRKHHNRGAMLNAGQGRRKIVAAVSVILTSAAFVLLLLTLGKRGNRVLIAGLTLLLGGAFSNTYDRLKRKYVVDYLSFHVKWERFRNIVFNISDFCIIIGALLAAAGSCDQNS